MLMEGIVSQNRDSESMRVLMNIEEEGRALLYR